MTTLLFIRHGQASFGAANYDVLSDHGAEQARALGRYLARIARPVDRVVTGTLSRQRDTARHAITASGDDGHALPETETDAGFDEYPAFEILDHCMSAHPDDPDVRAFSDGDLGSKERALHSLMRRWADGSLDVGALEPFAAFDARVNAAIERVLAGAAKQETVAIVTSGGPVAVAARAALGLSPATTLDLAWTILNASFTEIRRQRGALRLHRFNAVPHLEPDGWLTYR